MAGWRSIKCIVDEDDYQERSRADARAAGDKIGIGGWECAGGKSPAEARGFSEKLDRFSAPWAFEAGESFRAIASLELLGALGCVVAFPVSEGRPMCGRITISGATDNPGNRSVVARLLTTKFPLVVVFNGAVCTAHVIARQS